MAIFQCDLLKNSKNRCIAIATELFFVFFRREKNKHNGASYLISFTYSFLLPSICDFNEAPTVFAFHFFGNPLKNFVA